MTTTLTMPLRPPTDDPDAACSGTDPAVFFPETSHGPEAKKAKQICSTCPLKPSCARWGIHHEPYGIWGGMTESERNSLRKAEQITCHIVNSTTTSIKPKHGPKPGAKHALVEVNEVPFEALEYPGRKSA